MDAILHDDEMKKLPRATMVALPLLLTLAGACSSPSDADFDERHSELYGAPAFYGVFRPTTSASADDIWLLRGSASGGLSEVNLTFNYGGVDDIPVVGDWTGSGNATIGVFRKPWTTFNQTAKAQWLLRTSNTPGPAEIVFYFGEVGDEPVVGDWTGSGKTTVGLFRPVGTPFNPDPSAHWLLHYSNTAGPAELDFQYGGSGDRPVVGDWTGSGVTTIGVFRPVGTPYNSTTNDQWLLKNSNSPGSPDFNFSYGLQGDLPVVGDWTGARKTTVGVVRPPGVQGNARSEHFWLLRNSNTTGTNSDLAFYFGVADDKPVVGNWKRPTTTFEPFKAASTWGTSTPSAGTVGTFLAKMSSSATAALDLILVTSGSITVRPSNNESFGTSVVSNCNSGCGAAVMTTFADVTGDGIADQIVVDNAASNKSVKVRTGASSRLFSAITTWISSGFVTGTVGTYFADVDGDGKADAIAVDGAAIRVRKSTGSGFGAEGPSTTHFTGAGEKGVFFADVTGDRKADAIKVSLSGIQVIRSMAGAFDGTAETWSSTGFYGNRATFFTDVTGDGTADAVAVDTDGITMRRSGRWYFGTNVEALSTAETASGVAPLMGDMTGDQRSEFVEVSATAPIRIRAIQDRQIPIRFVQLIPLTMACASTVSDATIQAEITVANQVYKDVGVSFFAQQVANSPCTSNTLSHIVVTDVFDDVRSGAPGSQSDLAKLIPFNSTCDFGYEDIKDSDEEGQLWWVAARCARSGEVPGQIGEILAYVNDYGTNRSYDGGRGKMVIYDRSAILDPANGHFPHELGHYLGLEHVFSPDLPSGPQAQVDPATGQDAPLASVWDLVHAGDLYFNSRAAARAYEFALVPIEAKDTGWFCPNADNKPCPFTNPPLATIGIPVSGVISNPLYTYTDTAATSFEPRLQGLAPRVSNNLPGINVMSYSYGPNPGPDPNALQRRFSLAQIEVIQSFLKTDVVTNTTDANGRVLFGGRSRLGLTDAAPGAISWVRTGGTAKSGNGVLASNGYDAWMVGTNAYNADGNQLYQWDRLQRGWVPTFMGAAQVIVPAGQVGKAANVSPWAITSGNLVKRFDGSTLVTPPLSTNQCMISLAVGTNFAWAVGCSLIPGNRPISRYQLPDGAGVGWVQTNGQAVQVAVDGFGVPWARDAQGNILRATLGPDNMPVSWAVYHPASGATYLSAGGYKNNFLSPNFLGASGHVFGWSTSKRDPSTVTPTDLYTPPMTFDRIAGSLPYLWAIEPNGNVWYAR
jgi:hypothetical protein